MTTSPSASAAARSCRGRPRPTATSRSATRGSTACSRSSWPSWWPRCSAPPDSGRLTGCTGHTTDRLAAHPAAGRGGRGGPVPAQQRLRLPPRRALLLDAAPCVGLRRPAAVHAAALPRDHRAVRRGAVAAAGAGHPVLSRLRPAHSAPRARARRRCQGADLGRLGGGDHVGGHRARPRVPHLDRRPDPVAGDLPVHPQGRATSPAALVALRRRAGRPGDVQPAPCRGARRRHRPGAAAGRAAPASAVAVRPRWRAGRRARGAAQRALPGAQRLARGRHGPARSRPTTPPTPGSRCSPCSSCSSDRPWS